MRICYFRPKSNMDSMNISLKAKSCQFPQVPYGVRDVQEFIVLQVKGVQAHTVAHVLGKGELEFINRK